MKKEDYTLSEIFEEAKKDPSWEESEGTRAELVDGLVFQLLFSIT